MLRHRISARAGISAALVLVGIAALATGCTRKEVRPSTFSDSNPIPEGAGHRDVTGEHGGRLVYVTIGDPKTFNPVMANETSSTEITGGALFIGLTQYANGPQQVTPGIASSWDVSEDKLTYTFHLRPGIRWSDGEPLTADDVISSAREHGPEDHFASYDVPQSDGAGRWRRSTARTVALHPPALGPVTEVLGSMYQPEQARTGVQGRPVRVDGARTSRRESS
jgi:ABC-type transport system substrate-binding protein